MILGDNIFEKDFSGDIKSFTNGGRMFAKKVKDWQRFGVVKFDENNKAMEIVEKPTDFISDYASAGLYIFDNRVSEIAKRVKPSSRGEIEVVSVQNEYLKMGELDVRVFEGEWLDAGNFDSLLEAGNIVKQKELYKNFDPIIDQAIAEFNEEMKAIAKKKLL